jgi:hypothetical protein
MHATNLNESFILKRAYVGKSNLERGLFTFLRILAFNKRIHSISYNITIRKPRPLNSAGCKPSSFGKRAASVTALMYKVDNNRLEPRGTNNFCVVTF